jgi:hypothetical protein
MQREKKRPQDKPEGAKVWNEGQLKDGPAFQTGAS